MNYKKKTIHQLASVIIIVFLFSWPQTQNNMGLNPMGPQYMDFLKKIL